MWGRVAKIALSLPFLIVAGVFGAYLIVGFFLVNPLAQQLLPWPGEARLAMTAQAGGGWAVMDRSLNRLSPS